MFLNIFAMSLNMKRQKSRGSLGGAHTAHFSLQVLEANMMKGGVELLEMRPDQLTSDDLEGEQVHLEQAFSGAPLLILPLGKLGNYMACTYRI